MKWCVVTYQIPVPIGDCSIHVRHYGKGQAAAILIDGGTDAEASARIDQAWEEVKADLGITNLRLSGWIVTHWDQDHYKGGFAWLEDMAKEVLAEDAFLLAGHSPKDHNVDVSVSNRQKAAGSARA
jgi:glyoxylase-like metal-dependent hydrolase (beta-lactamase superfamily II)